MKYKNTRVTVDGISFDSRKEARHYQLLKALEKRGEITDLQRQVRFELIPAVYREEVVHLKTKDKTVRRCIQRAITYIADFVYNDAASGERKVVDTKGFRTKEYILKKKMMLALKGIDVLEV